MENDFMKMFKRKQELKAAFNEAWLKNELFKCPNFYHGTDAKILGLTEQQRQERLRQCYLALDFLWTIYEKYIDANGLLNEAFQNKYRRKLGDAAFCNLSEACSMNKLRLNGCGSYSYGSLYLTNSPERAMSYAQRASVCGELGNLCRRMYEAAIILGFSFAEADEEQQKALALMDELVKAEPEPVVCVLEGLKLEDIIDESGKIIEWGVMLELLYSKGNQGSYRYTKQYDLKCCRIITPENFDEEVKLLHADLAEKKEFYNKLLEKFLASTKLL